jgi:Flp pilus assembly protein TadB
LRPLCSEHRHAKLQWCDKCMKAWKATLSLREIIGLFSLLFGVFTVVMVIMAPALIGLTFGTIAALPGIWLLLRTPSARRKFELEGRERAAKQLPAGLDFGRDE